MEESKHFESLYPEDTRGKEIKKILEFIKSGRSCQVIGIPGVGRGSILGLLSYNKNVRIKHLGENQKWFHFVYMDFSEVRKRTLYEVIKFMLISTAYSLLERGLQQEYETVNSHLKEAIEFKDELILFQALKKSVDFLSSEKQLSVIFLFDRFEQYIPNITQEFFLDLKILRNRAKYRFACVFSQNRPLEDILETSIYSEFYEFFGGNDVYLDICDPVGIEFRLSYLEKVTAKKMGEKVKKEIIRLTAGHGKLVRIASESILSEPAKNKDLEAFLFAKSAIKGALLEITNPLTPSEDNYLKDAKHEEVDIKTEQYLENIGLVKNGKITIPLLEKLIKEPQAKSEEKLSYDSERNEIFLGNEQITEKLSPSEFRLLRFLMQNPQRICEKDEVIKAVWKEVKTQEGVTDQALDQIVYRLRKKIEDDPNNPVHIQTVKGRGFRFSP